jgi:hypothetical protein
VLGIGVLALLAWGADVARQRAGPWVRRRHALRRVSHRGETGA